MEGYLEKLRSKLHGRQTGIPSAQVEQLDKNLEHLAVLGVQTEADLSSLALDPSAEISARITASWLLARCCPKRASIPVLLRLLDHGPAQLRAEAARSLGLIKARRALPSLLRLARQGGEPILRESGLEALGLLGDTRAADTLLSIAGDEQAPPSLRGLAIEQLALLGKPDPRVLRALEFLLQDSHAEVAFWTIYVLGKIGDWEAVAALAQLAATDSRRVEPFGSLAAEAQASLEAIRHRTF